MFCLLALAILAAGCVPAVVEAPSQPAAPPFPIEFTDQAGNTVTITKIPERIVSLAPSNTEIVYALGLQDRLVAGTDYDDYPPEAKNKPKIGGFSSVDIERVVAFQPDLVLAADRHEETITPALSRLGITVLTLAPKSLDEVLDAISLTGRATGAEDRAEEMVSDMRARIKAVTDRTETLSASEKPGVFYVLWHDPLMTVGPGVLLSELITKAGGSNIAAGLDDDYPKISLEAVIVADPAIIITDGGHGEGGGLPLAFAQAEPRLEAVAARRNGRVYEIDSDLVTIAGPRIVAGLEEMARLLHPDIFGRSAR